MPRLMIQGEPGEVHTNDTPKVQYQLLVTWSNSCGICIQYDHQVGSYWPIPFHRNCNCRQIPVAPGQAAQPFVDYRAKIHTVSRSQQANIMGRSNLALVESGAVEWGDVVTPTRIRSLREVVSRKRLTVDQMVRSGVTRGRATQAYDAVHTRTHDATETRRQELVKKILAKGYTREQILDAAGRSLGSRVSIGEGPSGASVPTIPFRPTPKPSPAKPVLRKAALAPTPKPTRFGPTKATQAGDSKAQLELLGEMKAETGRAFTANEVASASGVPDNATFEIVKDAGLPGVVRFSGPGYKGTREISKADDGKFVVYNDSFEVEKGQQGKGIGAAMFGLQVEQASELGFGRIETYAARFDADGTIGYKVWPRFGYDGDIPAHIAAKLPDTLAGAKRVSDLMKTPEGRAWWDANGSSFDATFDLDPGSESRKVWDAYLARKAEDKKP